MSYFLLVSCSLFVLYGIGQIRVEAELNFENSKIDKILLNGKKYFILAGVWISLFIFLCFCLQLMNLSRNFGAEFRRVNSKYSTTIQKETVFSTSYYNC